MATAGGSKHDRLLLHCHDLLLRSLDRDPLTQGHQDDTTSPINSGFFLSCKENHKDLNSLQKREDRWKRMGNRFPGQVEAEVMITSIKGVIMN